MQLVLGIAGFKLYDYIASSILDYAIMVLILVVTGADAVRDAWMTRYRKAPYKSKDWYKRHYPKWISLYLSLGALMVLHVPLGYWPLMIILGYVVWRNANRHIGGVDWESHLMG